MIFRNQTKLSRPRSSHVTSTQRGFTIIELLIATTIFTGILLILTTAMLQIGKIYYKGVNQSRIQEATRAVISQVSQGVQFGSGSNIVPIQPAGGGSDISQGFCIGDERYSYLLDRLVGSQTPHALVVDHYAGCDGSSPALDLKNLTSANFLALTTSPHELVPFGMRLVTNGFGIPQQLPVAEDSSRLLWRIHVKMAYGENDLFADDGAGTHTQCASTAGSQYCATSELTTIVQKRVK